MKDVQVMLAALDAQITSYKQKNITSLPEISQVNLQAVDQVDRDIMRMNDEPAHSGRGRVPRQQLASIPRPCAPGASDEAGGAGNPIFRQAPDVIRTRAAIKELESDLAVPRAGRGAASRTTRRTSRSPRNWRARSRNRIIKRQTGELKRKRDVYWKRNEVSPGEGGVPDAGLTAEQPAGEVRRTHEEGDGRQGAHGLEKEQLGNGFRRRGGELPEKPSSPNIPPFFSSE
jgi:hypothetical protein